MKILLPFHPAFVGNNFQKIIVYSVLSESTDMRTDYIIGSRFFGDFLTESGTYPEVFLGRTVQIPFQILCLMHSQALAVLRFLCKSFSKLLKFMLRNITLSG